MAIEMKLFFKKSKGDLMHHDSSKTSEEISA